jgi:cbb3-type cytochrome oxidase subunit 3
MSAGEIGFLAFGGALVVLFLVIVRHYYARDRKAKVERAKYKMLDDE